SLKEVEICSLDLGLLQAGAGVKGEFEQRLKSVIEEIKEAPKPTIMFIDEAHTLIGAGGAAGTGDAANMLKPALARGELRSIAATTWSEYKKHIEKDPALARRFQLIKVEEPAVETAIVMMRGIKSKYEDHHNVKISEDAIAQAVTLADRFITGRQLPDKAVDLLDTSAARVKMTQSARPGALDDAKRRLHTLNIEIAALERDLATGLRHDDDVVVDLQRQRADSEHLVEALEARWDAERTLVRQVDAAREQIAEALQSGADADVVADHRASLAALQQALVDQRAAAESDHALVHAEVNGDVVAQVVSDWTGVPIGNMIKDEAQMLLTLGERLQRAIRGQDEALGQVADSVRSAKAGLGNPDAPLAVFLFVGPSGVGKTETARQLAEMMFGGERFLVSINMSEYQESHTVSQLKGSPPGYVGYGEGGILTEAVRQRPYSVVLLDEVEKAHIDVMELFYQVFDRGFMRDGEGREINFRNTIILATSNIGSDRIQQACMAEERPTADELRALIHDDLARHFQPALLARMKVVPYYSLEPSAMRMITQLKLRKIDRRLRSAHGIRFVFGDDVVDRIAERCTQVDAGARNIDFIIDRTLLPEASRALLLRLADDDALPTALHLGIDESGTFTYTFAGAVDAHGDGVATDEAAVLTEEAPSETTSDPEDAPLA
ncbi:MAG: type VI secretion system ATPase TssH, partial [Bacteroidota bacterium]